MSRLLILFAIILFEAQRAANGSHMSGLYLDNSLGQTVAHRVISLKEKRDIARDIVNFLELPMKIRRPVNETPQVRGSASNFIYDVYRNAVDENKGACKIVPFRFSYTISNKPYREKGLQVSFST